jgi:hypothetical protein
LLHIPTIGKDGRMYRVAAMALALIPVSADAAPVYLKCQLDPGAKGGLGAEDLAMEAPMDVTLNEDAGTVTYTLPKIGRAFTVQGVFTADKVSFNGFTVNRTNLAFERDMSALQAPGRPPIIDQGKCAIVQVNRAF